MLQFKFNLVNPNTEIECSVPILRLLPFVNEESSIPSKFSVQSIGTLELKMHIID